MIEDIQQLKETLRSLGYEEGAPVLDPDLYADAKRVDTLFDAMVSEPENKNIVSLHDTQSKESIDLSDINGKEWLVEDAVQTLPYEDVLANLKKDLADLNIFDVKDIEAIIK